MPMAAACGLSGNLLIFPATLLASLSGEYKQNDIFVQSNGTESPRQRLQLFRECALPADKASRDLARYKQLVDAIKDYAVYMLDRDGFVTSWNSGAERFKGYSEHEIVGKHFSTFYTEGDRAQNIPERNLAIAADTGIFESEGWRVRKDGTQFWTHVVIDPIRNAEGELVGFAKITRDLTDKKLAEDKLNKSEAQFRLLVQGVTDYAIYMLDRDGNIASWNAGAERIKGYAQDEVLGRHFSLFYPPEDVEQGLPQSGLATATREGRFEKEGWRVRKDGSRFWAHVIIDAIQDSEGKPLGFAKITRDITDRRKAEAQLSEAREALFQSQKHEAVGKLTGGVAHDFNNLLMVVLSSLEMIRKRVPEDDRLIGLLDNAETAARRGASLTQRMLAFAKQQPLEIKPVDLPTLVHEMRELLEHTVGSAVRTEVKFPLSLPSVLCDANQLSTALLNVVSNARDAMPGGGTILIEAQEARGGGTDKDSDNDFIKLAVVDDGEGMDKHTLARAADPFFTTKGVGKGTGLGLSMVQGLVEQSGGQLVLKSEKGRGTTVEIWLKASRTSSRASASGPSSAIHNGEMTRLKILAVDDDALVLMNTAAMLEDLGHKVVEAHSGDAALKVLENDHSFDLLITDQAMPRMTGLQLISKVKEKCPTLPVIMATGYAELEGGGADIPRLVKPFLQDQLEDMIAKVGIQKSRG